MSGFFVFILVAPLCVVTILGMALLSWGIRQCLLYFGFMTVSDPNSADSGDPFKWKFTNRRRRSSAITVGTEDGDAPVEDEEESENCWDVDDGATIYPTVTIRFLAKQKQDDLHEFLVHLSSYVHWPLDRLEILLCMDDDDHEQEGGEDSSAGDRLRTRSGLTEDNYQLILALMEEGFHMFVAASAEDLLKRPTRGSLRFSFDRIHDIPHPDFVQDCYMMGRTDTAMGSDKSHSRHGSVPSEA
jgi:hypothetical protein